MSDAVLVENGNPRGAIHLGAAADELHRFVSEEIQRYVELLSGGRLPIVTEPEGAPGGALILVGGPRANEAVRGLVERGAVDLGGLTADAAYLLRSVDLDHRGCVVAAGRDDAGTMYAAYELLERLGVVFQLTGDVVPARKATLELPELDVAAAPARKFRGVHVWHAYSWHMGMEDYRRLVDQLARMKMNVLQFYLGDGGAVGRGLPRRRARRVDHHPGVRLSGDRQGQPLLGPQRAHHHRHPFRGPRGQGVLSARAAVRGGVPGGRLRGRGVCRRRPVPAARSSATRTGDACRCGWLPASCRSSRPTWPRRVPRSITAWRRAKATATSATAGWPCRPVTRPRWTSGNRRCAR